MRLKPANSNIQNQCLWFAANAYCVSKGKRLPTIDEWEFAGLASTTQKDGSAEPGYNRTILDWYADGGRNRPTSTSVKTNPTTGRIRYARPDLGMD